MKGYQGQEDRANRMPMAFLPYQQRWAADMAQVKICQKSRRIGLSWAEAAEDSLLASQENGMDVFYIGYSQEMAQEFIQDCADWCRFYNTAAGEVEEFLFEDEAEEKKQIQAFRIKFKSGFKIVALSSRPRNLRSRQGKIVVDEAAFHDDLAGLLKAAMAMLIWGGRVVIISTHNGVDHPFNELVEGVKAGKKKYSLHTITFDDALRDGLYERVCLRRGIACLSDEQEAWRQSIIEMYGEDADEELFVIPSQGTDVYFSRALILKAMTDDFKVIRWKCKDDFVHLPEVARVLQTALWLKQYVDPHIVRLDPNLKTFMGGDFGRSGDLSDFWFFQEQPDVTYHVPFIIELRNVPFETQKHVVIHVLSRLPQFRGGALDARGNGQYLAEVTMQKFGANRIIPVMISQSWYGEAMPKYKAAYEDGILLIPRDSDVLEDHRAVKMTKGIAKVPDNYHTKGADGGQRHGDAAIGGCMGWYAIEHCQAGPIAYGHADPEPLKRAMTDNSQEATAQPFFNRDRGGMFRRVH